MKKGKSEKEKTAKDEEVNGQGRKNAGKGVPRPHTGYPFQLPQLFHALQINV